MNNSNFEINSDDILFGVGNFSNFIYYDAYPSDEEWKLYSVPVIYCLLMLATFPLGMIGMFFYGRQVFTNSGRLASSNEFGPLILSGWDHSIRNEKTSRLQRSAFKAQIEEKLKLEKSKNSRCLASTVSIVTWIIFGIIVVAVAYFIFWLSGAEAKDPEYFAFCRTGSSVHICRSSDLITYIVPLVSAVLASLLSRVFGFLSVFDKFHSAEYSTLYAIVRLMTLRMTILVIFILSTLNHKTSLYSEFPDQSECWERILGAEIYKLFIFESILSFLFNTILIEWIVTIIARAFR